MAPDSPPLRDYATRTEGPSPLGTSLFVGIRLLGPTAVYAIIANSSESAAKRDMQSYGSSAGLLRLSYPQLAIFLMAICGSLKQIFWVLAVSEQQMPAGSAAILGLLESGTESLNAALFMHSVPFGWFMFLEQPLPWPSEPVCTF